eukprot:6182357-Pleurochrysis_carterae.AAC.1
MWSKARDGGRAGQAQRGRVHDDRDAHYRPSCTSHLRCSYSGDTPRSVRLVFVARHSLIFFRGGRVGVGVLADYTKQCSRVILASAPVLTRLLHMCAFGAASMQLAFSILVELTSLVTVRFACRHGKGTSFITTAQISAGRLRSTQLQACCLVHACLKDPISNLGTSLSFDLYLRKGM